MNIVIDIPEETYKGVLDAWEMEKDRRFKNIIHKAIVNSVPYEGKTGHWIDQSQGSKFPCECSVCHTEPFCNDEGYVLSNYCPNCGAVMLKNTKL